MGSASQKYINSFLFALKSLRNIFIILTCLKKTFIETQLEIKTDSYRGEANSLVSAQGKIINHEQEQIIVVVFVFLNELIKIINIHPGEWDAQTFLEFWDKNRSPNFGQMTRSSDSPQRKRKKKENFSNYGLYCLSRPQNKIERKQKEK